MSDPRRGLLACLCLLLLTLPAQAENDDLDAMARKVKDYPTKFRLIAKGAPAVTPLMKQITSEDPWLAFESKSAVRWIVLHAKTAEAQATVAEQLLPFTRSEQPQEVHRFVAELFGDMRTERAVTALGVLLRRDQASAAIAAQGLGRIGTEAAVEKLLHAARFLYVERPDERRAVLRVLSDVDCLEALALFQADAKDGGGVGIAALGRLGGPADAPLLEALATKGSKPAQAAFADLALRVPPPSLVPRAWALGDASVRRRILSRIGAGASAHLSEDLFPVLDAALADPALAVAAQRAALSFSRGLVPGQAREYLRRVLTEARDEGVITRALGIAADGPDQVELATLEPHLASTNERIRRTALLALGSISGAAINQRLIKQLADEPDVQVKRLLVRVLHERAAPEAVEPLIALTRDADKALARDAGSAVLAMAANADVADARATYLRLVESKLTRDAVVGLGRTGDASVLPVLRGLLDTRRAALHDVIAQAASRIALRLLRESADEKGGIEAYRIAYDAGAAVVSELRRLGAVIEIRALGGRVTAWWVVGAFPAEGIEDWDRHDVDPASVSFRSAVKLGEQTLPWLPMEASGANGAVDLDSRLSPNDNVTAYAYAEIIVKRERDAVLKCGSDDGIYVWVNGDAVHAFKEPRGLTVDEDTVKIHLNEGTNRLLVKVCELGGGWEFQVRLEDEKGRPLKFLIR